MQLARSRAAARVERLPFDATAISPEDDARWVRQIRACSSSDGLRAIFPQDRIGIGHSAQKGEIMSRPIKKFSPAKNESRTTESHPTREEIELRAYQIYLDRGGVPGRDMEDWLQAERELLEKHGKTGGMSRAAAI